MSDRPEEWDRSRDEIISGEYVLGVLSAADRKKVEARMAVDRRFAMQVHRWERNLNQFNDDYEEMRPPKKLQNAILSSGLETLDHRMHNGFTVVQSQCQGSVVLDDEKPGGVARNRA